MSDESHRSPQPDSSRKYDGVAPVYDALAKLYSAGAISRAKEAHLPWLERGQTVLYVGAGTASECLEASRIGARVTIMDQSAKMLSRARARFDQSGLDAQFLEGDALSPLPFEFDVVVAPFFLNVFSQAELGRAFSLLCAHLRTGGSFISVDFRASTGGLFGALQRLHYLPPVLLFALLTSNPMHGPYDYVAVGEQAAPRLRLEARTITPAWGLPLYETLRWEKR